MVVRNRWWNLSVGLFLLGLSACQSWFAEDNTQKPFALPNTPYQSNLTLIKQLSKQSKTSLLVNPLYWKNPNQKSFFLSPTIVDKSLYLADRSGKLRRYNHRTGRLIWQVDTGTILTTPVSVAGPQLAVANGQGQFQVYHTGTGHLLWSHYFGREILTKPLFANNRWFVKTFDGQVSALSSRDGKILWTVPGQGQSLTLRATSYIYAKGDQVIVGYGDGQLIGYDIKTGQVLWEIVLNEKLGISPSDRILDVLAEPYAEGNWLYIANYQGQLSAINLKTGQTLWKNPVSLDRNFFVGKQHIYLTDVTARISAVNKKDGRTLWTQDRLTAREVTAPIIFQGRLVVGDYQGYLHFIDLTRGQLLGKQRISQTAIHSVSVLTQKTLLIITQSGESLIMGIRH